VLNVDGSCYWYLNGDKHRIGGPAIEAASGAKQWWVGGELHRDGGPAIEGADGTREWHRDGKRVPDGDFKPNPFDKAKVTEVRSAYAKPVKVVENRILAMRKKFLEDSDASQGTRMKPKF
jgi:hypothetical protein